VIGSVQASKAKRPAIVGMTKVRASRIDQLGRAIDLELTLSPLGLQSDFLTGSEAALIGVAGLMRKGGAS